MIARRALGALSIALTIAVMAGASALVGAQALGYKRYVITGRSMTGTIDVGSLAFERAVPPSSLKVGDVVTYSPPADSRVRGLVTHRIVWAGRSRDGGRAFRTKGDANPQPDPWRFVLSSPTQARVVFHVPYAGYALAAFSRPRVRMLLIGLPALLVAISLLAGLWEDAGVEARRLGVEQA